MAAKPGGDAEGEAEAGVAAAAKLMDIMLGPDILAAIHRGFQSDGRRDFRGVVAHLGKAAPEPARIAAQLAFELACDGGEAGVAGLCLAQTAVDPDVCPDDACASPMSQVPVTPAEAAELHAVDSRAARFQLGQSVFGAAVCRNDVALLRVLAAHDMVDVNASPFTDGRSALAHFCEHGNAECVGILLASPRISLDGELHPMGLCGGVRPGARYPLTVAAAHGHTAIIVTLLRAKGILVNHCTSIGETPLKAAVQGRHVGAARALLAAPDINVNGGVVPERSSHPWLAHRNNHDSDEDKHRPPFHTALALAVHASCLDIVRDLLAVDGIDVGIAASKDGTTAFMLAAQAGHLAIARAILAVDGASASAKRTTDGATALMLAAQAGRLDVARELIRVHGVDVNTTQADGSTALMLAIAGTGRSKKARQARADVIRALLAAPGMELDHTESATGHTALTLAIKHGFMDPDLLHLVASADGIATSATVSLQPGTLPRAPHCRAPRGHPHVRTCNRPRRQQRSIPRH